MTRNSCVNAFICGSHICNVQPSEFDSISVGPLWRPSTLTLIGHPSASIIGISSSLSLVERSQQPIDQYLRGTLIVHRLQQFCDLLSAELRIHTWISREYVAKMLALGYGLFAGGLDQLMRL